MAHNVRLDDGRVGAQQWTTRVRNRMYTRDNDFIAYVFAAL